MGNDLPSSRQIEYNGFQRQNTYEHQRSRTPGEGFDGDRVADDQRVGQGDAGDQGAGAAGYRGAEVLSEYLGASAGVGTQQPVWPDYFGHHEPVFSGAGEELRGHRRAVRPGRAGGEYELRSGTDRAVRNPDAAAQGGRRGDYDVRNGRAADYGIPEPRDSASVSGHRESGGADQQHRGGLCRGGGCGRRTYRQSGAHEDSVHLGSDDAAFGAGAARGICGVPRTQGNWRGPDGGRQSPGGRRSPGHGADAGAEGAADGGAGVERHDGDWGAGGDP